VPNDAYLSICSVLRQQIVEYLPTCRSRVRPFIFTQIMCHFLTQRLFEITTFNIWFWVGSYEWINTISGKWPLRRNRMEVWNYCRLSSKFVTLDSIWFQKVLILILLSDKWLFQWVIHASWDIIPFTLYWRCRSFILRLKIINFYSLYW